MNPSTGTFISMDSYQGSIYDPVTLHKYLYANANPMMYTDPSGYFSIAECSIATSIQSTLNSMHQINSLRKIIKWADAMCTVYDTITEIRRAILSGGSLIDVIGALVKGVVVGFMVDGMCKTSLGIVLKPMMAVFGLGSQVDQIQEAIESGDPAEIAVRFTQLICMLFGLTSQCFTGDTLVSTETGLCPIAEIQVGDYVWSEDTETGEKQLKQVTGVSVTMTNTLVYVTTEDRTSINTTENHPFYVEGKGWCAAAEIEVGDVCRTKEEQLAVIQWLTFADNKTLMIGTENNGIFVFDIISGACENKIEGKKVYYNKFGDSILLLHENKIKYENIIYKSSTFAYLCATGTSKGILVSEANGGLHYYDHKGNLYWKTDCLDLGHFISVYYNEKMNIIYGILLNPRKKGDGRMHLIILGELLGDVVAIHEIETANYVFVENSELLSLVNGNGSIYILHDDCLEKFFFNTSD